MRRLIIILVIFCCNFFNSILPQADSVDISATLEKLFTRLRGNFPYEKKIEINDSIRSIIDSYSTSDTVFNHRFTNIRFLGQITSPDSLVKIITWNLFINDGESSYFCNIIKRENISSGSSLFRLKGKYSTNSINKETIYSLSDWYGALYYDLRPFTFNGSVRYALLGIDYGNSFITRKVIDVLGFEGKEGIVFGLKCFTDGKTTSSRIVFEYSSTAVMSLRFEADDLIIFDHLSPFSPDLKDNHQFYGPDFSFDSYKFEKGLWRLKSDIDIKNR